MSDGKRTTNRNPTSSQGLPGEELTVMVYQGNNQFKLDPVEKADLWSQVMDIPSDPNGPPDLDAFEALCVWIERKVNYEADYHKRMRS